MSADDLIRGTSDVLFAVVALGAIAVAVRDRRRAAVDAALMFGALAFVVLQGEAARVLGVEPPPWASQALVVALLAVPYLFLRLVDDLIGIRAAALRAGLAGFVAGSALTVLAGAPYPVPVVVGVVAYFGLAEIYGAVVLVRESGRTAGVPRARARAAALGSVLLGVTLLVAGAQQFVPPLAPIGQAVTRLLVLCAALAYAASVVPPRILKQAWREPALRRFLIDVSSIHPDAEPRTIVAALEGHAARALGGTAAAIGLGAALDGPGPDVAPPVRDALVRAYAGGKPVLLAHPGLFGGGAAVLAAPTTARGVRSGALAVTMRRAPLYPEDELELVASLAEQAGLVLDGARLYGDLAAANRRLEDATRAKSEFLANMSHELRTPLNAVLGFSDLLVEQLDDRLTGAQRRYFTNIKDAGTHLLKLINEVLDLSKVEAGRLAIRPEAIRLGTLLEPVLASMGSSAAAAGHRFDAEVDHELVVLVDPGRARQILYNLLSNAVKFTPRGGVVTLAAQGFGGDLRIEVRDTGIGIPEDRRGRVFGTFERLHEGRFEASGTGLGLALTKKLVELHGGTIGLVSADGQGSTFAVTLPNVVVRPVRGPRVLIVEDDRRDAELLAALAGPLGVVTETVGTCSSARDALRRDAPMAVILDMRLPDERGEVLLREIKEDPALRSIPVLVVSVEDDEGRSRPLGADDHLTKPIDRDRVTAWMRRVVTRAEAATPAS